MSADCPGTDGAYSNAQAVARADEPDVIQAGAQREVRVHIPPAVTRSREDAKDTMDCAPPPATAPTGNRHFVGAVALSVRNSR